MSNLIFGLPTPLTYSLCMDWMSVDSLYKLDVALGSTAQLLNTLKTVDELHSTATVKCRWSLGWAMVRNVSLRSMELQFLSLLDLEPYLSAVRPHLISIKLNLGGIQRKESVEELNAERCPNLQELELVGHNVGSSLYEVLKKCPLRTLSLRQSIPEQPSLPTGRTLDLNVAQCATLRTLILSGYDILCSEETAERSAAVVPIFPELQHFEMRDRVAPNHILQALAAGGKLKSVFLRAVPMTADGLSTFAAATPELEHLWLGIYDRNRREEYLNARALWPKLRSLTVCSCDGDPLHLVATGVQNGSVRIFLSDQTCYFDIYDDDRNFSFVTINFEEQTHGEVAGNDGGSIAAHAAEVPPPVRVSELSLRYSKLSWRIVSHALKRIAPARPKVLQLESTASSRNNTLFVEMLCEACKTGCEVRLRSMSHWIKTQCPDVVFN